MGKIADFGLSVKIKRGEQHVSGIQHGTEGYVAPGAPPCIATVQLVWLTE